MVQECPQPVTDEHLRSAHEVIGYSIEALDGPIGHVEDLLFDEESWALHHIVVDARNGSQGKHVVISPGRIEAVSWPEHSVRVTLTRGQIESSPEFDPGTLPVHRNTHPGTFTIDGK